jgi:hypothetical protein
MKRSVQRSKYDLIGFPILSIIIGPPIGGFLLGATISVLVFLAVTSQFVLGLAGIEIGTTSQSYKDVVEAANVVLYMPLVFSLASYFFGLIPAALTAGLAVICMVRRARLHRKDIVMLSAISSVIITLGFFITSGDVPSKAQLMSALAFILTSIAAANFTYRFFGDGLSVDTGGYFDEYRAKRLLAEAPKP